MNCLIRGRWAPEPPGAKGVAGDRAWSYVTMGVTSKSPTGRSRVPHRYNYDVVPCYVLAGKPRRSVIGNPYDVGFAVTPQCVSD